ncbi:hypothetical protein ALC60_09042 [Trachymyrmex zeteki]|uniref:Uncharacterized protein n=1 Tax=Mycetomoellerius zeteki TaxID=64791 RepID=A0A151WVX8_9HYME|nr:hypothetical protein ALC60_09042 [Trachymyrmex zeteki]
MDRARLDEMSMEELRKKAEQLQLMITAGQDCASLIDVIMNHYERFRSALIEPTDSLVIIEGAVNTATVSSAPRVATVTNSASPWEALTQCLTSISAQLQQQQLLQQVVRSVNSTRSADSLTSASPPPRTIEIQPTNGHALSRQTSIETVSPTHTVNLLAPQIPEFGGTDTENAQLWIRRVDKVAHVHGAPDDVVLLAATTCLVKTARKYDLGSGPMIESWTAFREALISRFGRTMMFHVAM